ncbi:MAG: hypothetical protein WA924_15830 [Burkholderiaceae bacterium]
MFISSIKFAAGTLAKFGAATMFLGVLTACGGGGGDPGTGPLSNYSVNLSMDKTSVIYGGTNVLMAVKLSGNCGSGSSACDSVSGKVVALSTSKAGALSFTPATVITDSTGAALVTVTAASPDVSGIVDIRASVNLTGYEYSRSISVGVNNLVDRTITTADDRISTILGKLASCTDLRTYIVNVKNRSGVLQGNSVVTVAQDDFSDVGLKDLGLIKDLGRVWMLQVRPNMALCDASGAVRAPREVWFDVAPGDGSASYFVGYNFEYTTR